MACFLACFGFSKKPKRRKIGSKVLSVDRLNSSSEFKKRNRRKYESLNSEPLEEITRRSVTSDPESRDKPKEQSSASIKKKVSFNLNVTTYEPLSKSPESEEEEEETALHFVGDTLIKGAYPSNHRYQNFSHDEDEYDMELDESFSDLDDELYEEEDHFHYTVDEQYPKETELNYPPSQSQSQFTHHKSDLEKNCNARDRSHYVCSVLNPIENLSQWKAIKSKENVPEKKMYSSLKPSWDRIPLISAPNSDFRKS